MASMFRKPKRNFRQRVVTNDSDDDENENDTKMEIDDNLDHIQILPEPPKKPKEKTNMHKSSSVLSFDNDEGDTTFQLKKSSHSKKIAKQLKKEIEQEQEMRKTSKVGSEVQKEVVPQKADEGGKEVVEDRIKKLREELLTMNGDEAVALEDPESDEEGTFKKMLKRGEIPDATTIHQIRKQRQMARDMGDFMPLDDTVQLENSKSRLIRDDDNDKSDDEDERVDFAANKDAIERQRIRDNFMSAEHGSDEGSDQEREWEEQQIRMGVSAIQQASSSTDLYGQDADSQSGDGMFSNGFHGNQGYPGAGDARMSIPMTSLMTSKAYENITLEGLINRLKDRLTTMEEVHRGHKQEADKLEHDIEDSQMAIVNCEAGASKLEERFTFFQEMRGYVRDLVECLNEKVPEINTLETRMHTLLKNRAAKFASRRQQDIQDQCQAYMTNKAKVVVDKEDAARQRRIAEREARRARRRRAREGKSISGHNEGLSSDDEENQSEISKYNQERDDILERAEQVFEDVVNDFSDTDCVRERFSAWRNQYGESYTEAYISLCLPKLVNPFVRLRLVSWNPFQEQCKDIEEMRWFDSLLFFGFEEGETADKDNEDIKILPAVVEKVVLPKLTYLAENVWDPLSTAQTCRLVNLTQKLLRDYPTVNGSSKNTQALLRTLVLRMKKALDDDVFMPLYPKTVLENRNSGPSVFFHRQSWTCIKLLGHFLSWNGIVSNKILQGLALDGLLNRYILLGLQTAPFNQETLQKCQAIVSTFPKPWFEELQEEKTIPQLENLCRFLCFASQLLDKASLTSSDMQKREMREQQKQIRKLLVTIHALDYTMKLSESGSLR
ncbi:PAX3- and PAX7-binding protein 1-like [Mya arenaria]|uniref:PAX3- and PAX7-binding protein 1-like n=1 Tax=Mya arenaria TaxID=6604 RepID=UPI0022E95DED|nr:PAX3- and PAX7-binding protein 1-like [Mya arenaria]